MEMAALSLLVQLAAFVAGVYLMFDTSFVRGVSLMALVAALHFGASAINNAILAILQKRMSDSENEHLAHMARLGLLDEAAPTSWHIASNIVALLFAGLATASIYWFWAH